MVAVVAFCSCWIRGVWQAAYLAAAKTSPLLLAFFLQEGQGRYLRVVSCANRVTVPVGVALFGVHVAWVRDVLSWVGATRWVLLPLIDSR